MPDRTDQVITLLRSIDSTLKRMAQSSPSTAIDAVAPPADLDGKYGDPKVTFMPRGWDGDSYKGVPFSACPPELLDLVAPALDWVAQQAEANGETTSTGKPVAPYKRKDAARARGWAKRKREGWRPPDSHPADSLLDTDDPEIDPFGGDDMPSDQEPF